MKRFLLSTFIIVGGAFLLFLGLDFLAVESEQAENNAAYIFNVDSVFAKASSDTLQFQSAAVDDETENQLNAATETNMSKGLIAFLFIILIAWWYAFLITIGTTEEPSQDKN